MLRYNNWKRDLRAWVIFVMVCCVTSFALAVKTDIVNLKETGGSADGAVTITRVGGVMVFIDQSAGTKTLLELSASGAEGGGAAAAAGSTGQIQYAGSDGNLAAAANMTYTTATGETALLLLKVTRGTEGNAVKGDYDSTWHGDTVDNVATVDAGTDTFRIRGIIYPVADGVTSSVLMTDGSGTTQFRPELDLVFGASVASDITATGADVDSAVALKHTQGTDTTLGTMTGDTNYGAQDITNLVRLTVTDISATSATIATITGTLATIATINTTTITATTIVGDGAGITSVSLEMNEIEDVNPAGRADGDVLTWSTSGSEFTYETPAGAGDMLKSTYDTDTSGVVDIAEGVSNGVTTATATAVIDAADKRHTQGTDTALGAMAASIDMNGNDITNVGTLFGTVSGMDIGELDDVSIVSRQTSESLVFNAAGVLVNRAFGAHSPGGDTSLGPQIEDLDMNSNKIVNLAAPIGANDGARLADTFGNFVSPGTLLIAKVGTPANDEIGVWTGDGTIEGDANFTWNGSVFDVTGNILVSGTVDGVDISSLTQTISDTDMVLSINFNEDNISGTAVFDSSGLNNHGSMTGSPVTPTTGGFNDKGYITMDGTDDYVLVADDSSLQFGTGDFTLTVWVVRPLGGESWGGVVVKGMTTAAPAGTWGLVRSSGSTTGLRWLQGNGGGFDASITFSLSVVGWNLVVVVRSGSTVTVYVNGSSVGSDSSAATDFTSTNPVYIGRDQNNLNLATDIDEVRLYKRALDSDERDLLFDSLLERGTAVVRHKDISVDANGDVGIGEVSQDRRLDVVDSNATQGTVQFTNNNGGASAYAVETLSGTLDGTNDQDFMEVNDLIGVQRGFIFWDSGGVGIRAPSDRRIKKDITTATISTDTMWIETPLQKYRTVDMFSTEPLIIGFTAQHLQRHFPGAVGTMRPSTTTLQTYGLTTDTTELLTRSDTALILPMFAQIRRLTIKAQKQQKRIVKLENAFLAMNARISALEGN